MIRLLLLLVLSLLPLAARAQEGAALVADSLLVTADERLIATGNVQAFFEGTVLSAARITYDRRADRLLIDGPILIRDPDATILTAERAEIDPRLEQGLLRGARLVLDRRLQIAANRIDRAGSLTALTGAAATACQVCPGRAPLWEIRAAQVIYDEVEEQLYFEDARFLIRGVPILWLPRLRLPGPDNERSTGLLFPRLRSTGRLGLGLQIPYFIVLGPSRDLTLSPFISAETLTLEARYREAFLNGDLEQRGAVSRDDLGRDGLRGYVTAEGAFALSDGLNLAFDATVVSDDDYASDYGLSDADRIESLVRLTRVGQTSLFEAGLVHTRALEEGDEVPPLQGTASFERRLPFAGGTLDYGTSVDGVLRTEEGAGETARDVLRAGGLVGWRLDRVLGYGVLVKTETRVVVDAYRVTDDSAFEESLLRATPAAALTLRWPLVRRGTSGIADLIEPVASISWTAALGDEPPNEDSRLPEFDETNLHALSRLPGQDAVEEGGRMSLGLSWTRTAPGAASTLSVGRVFRTETFETSAASGLDGTASDWLVAGQIDFDASLGFDARLLLNDDLSLGKSEARLDWSGEAVTLEATYVRLPPDRFEDRPDQLEELSFEGKFRPSDRWEFRTEARYDLAREDLRELGVGLTWRNECVEVDVSLSRSYTSSNDEEPSTDFGLSVDLIGFSAGSAPRAEPGACHG